MAKFKCINFPQMISFSTMEEWPTHVTHVNRQTAKFEGLSWQKRQIRIRRGPLWQSDTTSPHTHRANSAAMFKKILERAFRKGT